MTTTDLVPVRTKTLAARPRTSTPLTQRLEAFGPVARAWAADHLPLLMFLVMFGSAAFAGLVGWLVE